MVRVQYVHFKVFYLAYHVTPTLHIDYAHGFTKRHARCRLYKKMGI